MCQVCEHYVAQGGVIHVYPFGLSGLCRKIALERDRKISVAGWYRRFGARQVPEDALPFILDLRLSVPVARVEMVWMAARDPKPVPISAIANRVNITAEAALKTADVLINAHRMERTPGKHGNRYRAIGDTPPHWREFLGRAA